MKKTEAIKLIDSTFRRLDRVCESSRDWPKYLAIIDDEEKRHRRFCPEGISNGLTKAQAVRLFAIKTVFERWGNTEDGKIFIPEANDFFTIRTSIFAACAITHQFGKEIFAEFGTKMIDFLHSVDYAELNKDPRQLQAA